jgi:hypothetical protein
LLRLAVSFEFKIIFLKTLYEHSFIIGIHITGCRTFPEQKEDKDKQTKPARGHGPVLFLAGCVRARLSRTWS